MSKRRDMRDNFRTVKVNVNVEEMNAKIRAHRKKVFTIVLLILIICVSVLIFVTSLIKMHTFSGYTIISSKERNDSEGTQFAHFNGNILKYNNDGISCISASNDILWNQTYEMASPQVDTCEGYAVAYDLQGTGIYILNDSGQQGYIAASNPIGRVRIAQNGVIAVLTEEGTTSHIQLYDKAGKKLAQGEIHIGSGGYPVDIALCRDAKKLAVAMLDVKDGSLKTTVTFYNFGSVGQSESDNIVSSFSYSGLVIPKVEFVTNNTLVAFGDKKIIVFEGEQRPDESATLDLSGRGQSIFYNEKHFGLIAPSGSGEDKEEDEGAYVMSVYSLGAKLVMEESFDIDYDKVFYLENGEICVKNSTRLIIFEEDGSRKLETRITGDFKDLLPGWTYMGYHFFVGGKTLHVRMEW